MSDRWWGYIQIDGAPSEWVTAVEHTSAGGGTYTISELVPDAMPEKVREAIELLGVMEVEFDDTGSMSVLKLEDGELAGGSWRFIEDGLTDALMEAGYGFEGGDDGDYGCAGMSWWWQPGMDGIEQRTAAAGEGIVLAERELREMVTATHKRYGFLVLDDLLERLRTHFKLATDDPMTTKEEAAA